jgi:hypothetical protein
VWIVGIPCDAWRRAAAPQPPSHTRTAAGCPHGCCLLDVFVCERRCVVVGAFTELSVDVSSASAGHTAPAGPTLSGSRKRPSDAADAPLPHGRQRTMSVSRSRSPPHDRVSGGALLPVCVSVAVVPRLHHPVCALPRSLWVMCGRVCVSLHPRRLCASSCPRRRRLGTCVSSRHCVSSGVPVSALVVAAHLHAATVPRPLTQLALST